MAGNPRENVKDKGFWDGGASGQSENGQSGGRPSGFPGERSPKHTGLRSDIEFPDPGEALSQDPDATLR